MIDLAVSSAICLYSMMNQYSVSYRCAKLLNIGLAHLDQSEHRYQADSISNYFGNKYQISFCKLFLL